MKTRNRVWVVMIMYPNRVMSLISWAYKDLEEARRFVMEKTDADDWVNRTRCKAKDGTEYVLMQLTVK